jgi:two-component system, cell cycle sensor histidine kinase and response regulator CckA
VSENPSTVDPLPWLAAIVASADEAMLTKTIDGTVITWNDGAAQLFGYSADEMIGGNISRLVPRTLRAECDELLARLSSGERIVRYETQRLRKDGTTVDVELSLSPVRDADGTIVGSTGIARDVGAVRRREEELRRTQKLEAVGRLAGGVAHDFNNLLTAIMGYASIALEGATGEARDALGEILRSAHRAGDLTRQLLAFARGDPSSSHAVDLSAVVSGLEPLLRRVLGEELDVAIVLGEIPPVEADATQLEQVVINLALNARDAMPSGGTLAIETKVSGPEVQLRVADTGVGMDAETQARAFEPFFTTKDLGKGTGIGLATVHAIVEQHGGRIEVVSALDRGTVFTISLPACTGECPDTAPPSADTRAFGGSETILVVEDDDGLRELTSTVLEQRGYRVIAVPDADAAFAVATNGAAIDLLISDVVMPRVSGPELARRLHAAGRAVPTIFMSGYTGETMTRHGLLEEGDGFLVKPFTPQLLLERVRTLLDRAVAT